MKLERLSVPYCPSQPCNSKSLGNLCWTEVEIQFNKACGYSGPGSTGDSAGLGFAEKNAKYCMSL